MLLAAMPLGATGCRCDRRGGETTETTAGPSSAALPSGQPELSTASFIRERASFDVARVRVTLRDIGMGTAFDAVALASEAELVVNGGFFGEHDEPLGLAISEGRVLSSVSRSMSGGVVWIQNDLAHLSATEAATDASTGGYGGEGAVDFAVQCRPRLVVDSHSNIRSDDGRRAPRTAICLRAGGRVIEFVLAADNVRESGPTLFELAARLTADGCENALNLDGGPSSGWASRTEAGMSFVPPRGPVRHVIVVTRR
jgi:uncharacterized protein YigE (DUF2233 family)